MSKNFLVGLFFISLSVSAFLANNVCADSIENKLGIGGTVGAAIPTGVQIIKDTHNPGVNLGGWIRYGMSSRWGMMLSYDNLDFTDGLVRVEPILLSATYAFLPGKKVVPFMTVGTGNAVVHGVKTQDYNTLAAQAGLGIECFFSPSFALGILGRYHHAGEHSEDGVDTKEIHAVTVGLMGTCFFGACEKKAAAPPPAPVVQEIVQKLPEVQKPADGDEDGVPDTLDKEPNTPQGNLVDKDGVSLSERVSITMNIEFDSGKADIKPAFNEQIKNTADFLQHYPTTTAEIEGHSDNVGSDKLNEALSQKRADSVRQYLISQFGIDANRLTAKGYGSTKPIADNKTKEGRKKNRRVVATITTTKNIKK